MYKITYTNGYIRYSIHKYGRYDARKKPEDVLKSEPIKDEDIKCEKKPKRD